MQLGYYRIAYLVPKHFLELIWNNSLLSIIMYLLAFATPDTNAIIDQLGKGLTFVFSSIALSAINILASGHMLSYILGLRNEGVDFFNLRIPWLIKLEIRGRCVVAGFAAFAVSIFVVGKWFSDMARTVFIENTGATENKWTATLLTATSLAVISCVILAAIRVIIDTRRGAINQDEDIETDEDRVRHLTSAATDQMTKEPS